jgi:RNA polymerase sigma-70 factor (ECF subfamily)
MTVRPEGDDLDVDGVLDVGDVELWRQVSGGSQAAFAEFFRRHLKMVWNYAYRLTGSWQVAEDVASNTFFIAWRKRTDIVLIRDSALPWLYTIAGNVVRDEYRSAARRAKLMRRVPFLDVVPDHAESVSSRIDDQTAVRQVCEAVRNLPVAQRQSIELCLFGELPPIVAAETLGIPEGTMRSNLSRARARLRTILRSQESENV